MKAKTFPFRISLFILFFLLAVVSVSVVVELERDLLE